MRKYITGLIAILSLIVVSYVWYDNMIASMLLIVLSLILLRKNNFASKEIKFYLISGFSGSISEMFAIYHGARYYANADFLIPVWLFFLRGIAGIVLIRGGKKFI